MRLTADSDKRDYEAPFLSANNSRLDTSFIGPLFYWSFCDEIFTTV